MKRILLVLLYLSALLVAKRNSFRDKFARRLEKKVSRVLESDKKIDLVELIENSLIPNRSAKVDHIKQVNNTKVTRNGIGYPNAYRKLVQRSRKLTTDSDYDLYYNSKRTKKSKKQLTNRRKKVFKGRKMSDYGPYGKLINKFDGLAHALGIRTKFDALAAGVGTGALAYGVHHRSKSQKLKQELIRKLRKRCTFKKEISNDLDQEILNLRTLSADLEDAGRKTSLTQETIQNSIHQKMLLLDPSMY